MTQLVRKRSGISLPSRDLFELIRDVCSRGAAFRFRAQGHSMNPAIRDNDIVTISPLNGSAPAKGDVIAFRKSESESMFVHRVVGVQTGKMVLRGDASDEMDGLIGPEDIAGVVTRVERGGRIVSWPDRINHPRRTQLFFSVYLFFLTWKRIIRKIKTKTIRGIELHPGGKLLLDEMRKKRKRK